MDNPLKRKLVPIKDLQNIRGIDLPVGLEFLQLVVTGPPGAGKTYYINQIRGWPNEGFIDLTKKGWWKDRSLIYRPREVHLGLPFKGFTEALTVFDKEWLDSAGMPPLELQRIQIPPSKNGLFSSQWKDKYIFEFILPDPEVIFNRRQARNSEGYFPVDANLTLNQVIDQVAVYREVALYLHRAGIQVYIRTALDAPPMRISEKGDASVPTWALSTPAHDVRLNSLSGWKQLFLRRDPINWFSITETLQAIDKPCRIAHDGKSFEMHLGKHRLFFQPEIPLGSRNKLIQKNWIITSDQACSNHTLNGFARIKVGETVMIGRGNEEFHELLHFRKSVAKRHVTITNNRGDLSITPLCPDSPVRVVRYEDADNREKFETHKFDSILKIRDIYGGTITILPPEDALSLLKEVNSLLEQGQYRPKDRHGNPGGVVELPSRLIPVIISDLHAQVDNLLKVLSENCLLDCLADDKAALIILGDAVHSEVSQEMENMDSSVLMIDLILKMKRQFPNNIFYFRGNHDSFDPAVSKGGISQGVLMKQRLHELRGPTYLKEMMRFHSLLPYVVTSDSFIACHASPPDKNVTKQDLINIQDHPKICEEIICRRLKRPNYFAGYEKKDVKRFRKNLNVGKNVPFIVGHTPLDPFGSVWQNAGAIKNHHIIYSGHQQGPSLFIRVHNKMVPLSYPAEPLLKIINKIK